MLVDLAVTLTGPCKVKRTQGKGFRLLFFLLLLLRLLIILLVALVTSRHLLLQTGQHWPLTGSGFLQLRGGHMTG